MRHLLTNPMLKAQEKLTEKLQKQNQQLIDYQYQICKQKNISNTIDEKIFLFNLSKKAKILNKKSP